MQRREILTGLGFTLGGLLGQACFSDTVAATMPQRRRWGYIGEVSPEHWHELSKDYQVCQMGQRQSPINIADLETANTRKIGLFEGSSDQLYFRYGPVNLDIFDAGYTLQANVGAGLYLELGGDRYDLKQFHFHTPSEHQMGGQTAAMELHLVHSNDQGEFAVVALLIEENKNKAGQGMSAFEKDLEPMWSFFKDSQRQVILSVHLAKLLPSDHHFYRYPGSLTTPPCSETVEWIIFQTPVTLSTERLAQYKMRFRNNARPIQRQ